ncbi:CRISPR-associated endonuclease Cas1 [uncultured Actinomyces sp.]|uniref:CRISPR-associated endonuclease Cas1 n=1 Tax=uncultured Actinomyces sp. TaxID=249061 RepID=UPI0028D13689|nr:CRISPR-associated endonuclease Cas1 [uncultured Actinomyces sp.]
MTTPATASSLREALAPEALTRARRRLLTAHPDPTSSDTSASGSLSDEQLRDLAAQDWAPPPIPTLDTNSIATADPVTRALLAESVRETLERRLTTERPNGTFDDTRAGHDAFSRGVVDDYDHGNHHLARAIIRPADPGLVTGAALSRLGLPDTDAPVIEELAQASDLTPLTRILTDAALLDLDRYATGQGLRYSRVGTALMLAAPSEQRLAEAIDAVAAVAINAGARVTDLTTQHIDEEKALASVGIDPWTTRPGDEPTGQADRILYVGRDGARVHVKAGRVLVDAPGSLPATSVPKNSVTRIVLSGNVGLSAGARSWAMRSGVDVVCLSRRGSYQGTLIGANRGAHASRLLAQVALTGDRERRVRLAASLIGAKIRGQIHVLTRIARRDEAVHVADTTAHMHAWRRSLAGARTLDEIMGIEGACSNAYFDALSACVPADVTFDGRSRRPPRDVPNAALSYGYAILLSECVGALHAAGLEPSLGVAHAPTDKSPSLALDLMEQFRPLLVDQTVMALLRARKLRPEHGVVEAEAGGVWLGGDGKKILVDAYEAASQRSVTGALPGYSGS